VYGVADARDGIITLAVLPETRLSLTFELDDERSSVVFLSRRRWRRRLDVTMSDGRRRLIAAPVSEI